MHAISRYARMLVFIFGMHCVFAPAPAIAQVTASTNFQGLWWAAPAGSESGWGINFAHQGDVIFATWFTYNTSGSVVWWSMTANQVALGVFHGQLIQSTGTPITITPYDNNDFVAGQSPGEATLTFTSATTGVFSTRMGSINQDKPIVLQTFGPAPTCVWGAQPDLSKATNYTDLWWASPPGSENGWGINLTHQGTFIFATWFIYSTGNPAPSPLWYTIEAPQIGQGTYSGTLYKTKGPPYSSDPFDPLDVTRTAVGTATFTFHDGNNATFVYSIVDSFQVNGVKQITRLVFRPPGTVCQ